MSSSAESCLSLFIFIISSVQSNYFVEEILYLTVYIQRGGLHSTLLLVRVIRNFLLDAFIIIIF